MSTLTKQSSALLDVVVVGAGVTGITAARALQADGLSVRVLDKGRGLGGRVASRRHIKGASFDHGAVLFATDVSSEGTQWQDGFVGVPDNRAAVESLASGLDVHTQTQVGGMTRTEEGVWSLADTNGQELVQTKRVFLSVPAPQAIALLEPVDEAAEMVQRLADVTMVPTWTLMLAFPDQVAPDDETPIRPFSKGSDLHKIVHNSAKPQRPDPSSEQGALDCWVVHASVPWTQDHLELERDEVAPLLLAKFAQELDMDTDTHGLPRLTPSVMSAHRWRYAFASEPLGQPCLANDTADLVIGGDWCTGKSVEDAMASGIAAAKAIVAAHTEE